MAGGVLNFLPAPEPCNKFVYRPQDECCQVCGIGFAHHGKVRIERRKPISGGISHGRDDINTAIFDHFATLATPGKLERITKTFSPFPQKFLDPAGMVMPDPTPEERKNMPELGQGYPQNQIFQIAIIENPPITLDANDQKPPRMVLKPTPYLAPSIEIAFIMCAKDIATDADLQRCAVRVAHG